MNEVKQKTPDKSIENRDYSQAEVAQILYIAQFLDAFMLFGEFWDFQQFDDRSRSQKIKDSAAERGAK
jgi:preprotein translocase subunit SecY